jgi:hypothetical protein
MAPRATASSPRRAKASLMAYSLNGGPVHNEEFTGIEDFIPEDR